MGFVLVSALPATADEGSDYLRRITDYITQTAAWWDQLWDDTFDPSIATNTINNQAVMDVVRYILLAGFAAWTWRIGQKIFDRGSDFSDWVKFLLPVVLISVFLANSGSAIYHLAHGLRNIANFAPQKAAAIQVAGFNVRRAIDDALFTQVTRTVISQEAKKCAQIQPPSVNIPEADRRPLGTGAPRSLESLQIEGGTSLQQRAAREQLACLQSLEAFVQEQYQTILAACPDCKTAQDLVERGQETVSETLKRNSAELAVKGFDTAVDAAIMLISPGAALAKLIASEWQDILTEIAMVMAWIFVAGQELALLLAALLGPIAFAMGTIPQGHNAIIEWLLFFARVLLVRLAYVILIGFVALMISGVAAAPLIFPLFFGIFAPYIAYKAVNDGVGAAADSFRSKMIGTASAGVSLLSGGVIALNSALQSRAMRYR